MLWSSEESPVDESERTNIVGKLIFKTFYRDYTAAIKI